MHQNHHHDLMIIILQIFDLDISPSLRPDNEDDDATTLDQENILITSVVTNQFTDSEERN